MPRAKSTGRRLRRTKENRKMEKDTRPVRCYICRKKMYYTCSPKHEEEFHITDTFGGHLSYVHARCVKTLRATSSKQEANK